MHECESDSYISTLKIDNGPFLSMKFYWFDLILRETKFYCKYFQILENLTDI